MKNEITVKREHGIHSTDATSKYRMVKPTISILKTKDAIKELMWQKE